MQHVSVFVLFGLETSGSSVLRPPVWWRSVLHFSSDGYHISFWLNFAVWIILINKVWGLYHWILPDDLFHMLQSPNESWFICFLAGTKEKWGREGGGRQVLRCLTGEWQSRKTAVREETLRLRVGAMRKAEQPERRGWRAEESCPTPAHLHTCTDLWLLTETEICPELWFNVFPVNDLRLDVSLSWRHTEPTRSL